MRNHLRLMPLPSSPQHPERIIPAILAGATRPDDLRRTNAALLAALADKHEIIADLQARLDESEERCEALTDERDHWRRAYTLATARRGWFGAGWWALLAMGWWQFWDFFETDASRGEAT